MRSLLARVALASALGSVGCAQGSAQDGEDPARIDAATDRSGIDVAPFDAVRPDASPPDAVRLDVARPDGGVLDVVPPDVVSDVATLDAGFDVAPPDLVQPDVVTTDAARPEDVRADLGTAGPVACTPATASTVCGPRPCVDGYCCDGACDGACRSCALPGTEGRCTNRPAATDPESECPAQAPATCGTAGACDGAGACARHPRGTACDDGAACTTADTCDGAGVCRGAAPASCAPGTGNQCCLGSCDPMVGCRTTAGLCADQCDANHLRTGRACQGCGAAGAAGTCGGGGDFACDATTHSLCRAIPCGGQTFYCTNDGGVWQWRTGTRCDDGNACTYADACGAGACGGTAVACASDPCATRACAGAATCAVTPHPGVACDDGNALTNSDVCSAAGACVGAVVCALPADACGDGAQSRDRCTNARVIGRRAAASTAGYAASADTCGASNRFDDCDWDAGSDHAYRIWARAGETISASVTRGSGCVTSTWSATLKLYQGGDCGTVTCGRDVWCRDHIGASAQTYVAPRDGWIVVIVDGSTAFDDEGAYTLRVRLTGCREGTCGCP